jgi:hypothetical protein
VSSSFALITLFSSGVTICQIQSNQVLKVQHMTDWMAGAAAQPDVMQIAYSSQALQIYVRNEPLLGQGPEVRAACMK